MVKTQVNCKEYGLSLFMSRQCETDDDRVANIEDLEHGSDVVQEGEEEKGHEYYVEKTGEKKCAMAMMMHLIM